MRLLLDTHALLWWSLDHPKLSKNARQHIADEDNQVFVSAASAWEIFTKQRLGKLGLAELDRQGYQSLLETEGFTPLDITTRHAIRAGSYTQPHADPFDRMLAAQAELEELVLMSCDPAMAQFGIETIW